MSKARKSERSSNPERNLNNEATPYLCVDFVLRGNLMFLLIRNLSAVAATDVRISFSQDIQILQGSKALAKLSIFSKLRYLAPNKEIEIFLDAAPYFLSQFKDTVVTITISYISESGKQAKKGITHDLAIYFDLPTTINY